MEMAMQPLKATLCFTTTALQFFLVYLFIFQVKFQNDLKSWSMLFYLLCFIWLTFRSLFWAMTMASASHWPELWFYLLYWVPNPIEFGDFMLLPLFYFQVLYERRWKAHGRWILACFLVAVALLLALYLLWAVAAAYVETHTVGGGGGGSTNHPYTVQCQGSGNGGGLDDSSSSSTTGDDDGGGGAAGGGAGASAGVDGALSALCLHFGAVSGGFRLLTAACYAGLAASLWALAVQLSRKQNRWKRKRFMIKGPKSLLILTTALIGIFVSRTAYNIGSFLGIWQIPTIPLSASSDIGWDHFTIFLAWDFFPAFFGLLIVTGKSKHSSTPSATEMSSSKKSKQSGRNHHGRSRGGGGGGGGRRYAAHDPALYLDNISSPSQGPQKGPGGGGGGGGGGGPGSLVSYSLESDLESPMLGPVAAAVGAPAPRVQVQHAQGLVSYQTYPCPVKEGESILGANVQPQAYGSLSYDSGDGAPVYGNTGEMPSWMASLRLPQTAVYHNPRGHWAAAPPPPRAPLGGTAAAAAAAAATAGRPPAGGGGRVGGGRSQVRFANTNADPRVSSGRHGRQTGAGNHQQANAGYQVPQQQFRRPNNHQQATRSPQYQASSGQPAMFLPETQGTIGTSSNLSSMRRLSGDSRRDGQRRLSAGAGGGNFYNPPDPALHHHR